MEHTPPLASVGLTEAEALNETLGKLAVSRP